MTTLATLLPLVQSCGLPTAGPFATPSLCQATLRADDADAFDAARWVAIATGDAGILLVGNDGAGLPTEIEAMRLDQLADRRERGDLLATLRGIDLGASSVLFDAENLAWFPSPPAAEAWLLRRSRRRADAAVLRRCGIWVTRGERGVVVFAPNEDAMLVASIRLRQRGLMPKLFGELYAKNQLPLPRSMPPFDLPIAKEIAAMLQETNPGARNSLCNYLAYLGPHRCLSFARLAVELAAHPEWELTTVHEQLAAVGLGGAGDEDTSDPRIGSNGPRSVGGVCFRLLSRWVGRRLAGWIEYQGG